MASPVELLAAIDVGAGSGAKVGLFTGAREEASAGGPRLLCEAHVPVAGYGGAPGPMADALADAVRALVAGNSSTESRLAAAGIACPGLFRSDGTTIGVANLPFLKGASLPGLLGERLSVPASIANDADAGGLAEWAVAREELLYWVLGGGWGGAWVSGEGRVMFPALDWDGRDETLHYSNEPGYSVPLAKEALGRIFADEGASLERFEEVVRFDLGEGALRGPGDRADALRAETVVSGPGRSRVFKVFASADAECAKALDSEEKRALEDPAAAGAVITALGERGVAAAVRTDRVFGWALAEAGATVIAAAERDGCARGAPVRVAGGPAKALHLFGDHVKAGLLAHGYSNEVRLSRLEDERRNANLLGAAVMAAGLAAGLRAEA
ncbi:MAG: ROK family protein [Planctomycetota bacterium]|jgi:predicted NBD/HSP70 family sugar kinase